MVSVMVGTGECKQCFMTISRPSLATFSQVTLAVQCFVYWEIRERERERERE